MTMVEVKDDKNVKDKSPDDAKFLSDKNRDVAEETRAQKTNLEKESEGKAEASKESDDKTSAEIGGPDDKIRQLEETKPTTDKRIKETDHSGDKQVANGEIVGEGGDNGEEGTGDNSPGVLSMRGIGGRGSVVDQSHDGKKLGKRGLPGVNSQLAFNDYERIMGKEKVDEERQVAARRMSAKKGRWERKLDAIKSSLENFVPDVRPGNQTALKTRAHPYALYIARMHRRIHELWGFGFLEDLDEQGRRLSAQQPRPLGQPRDLGQPRRHAAQGHDREDLGQDRVRCRRGRYGDLGRRRSSRPPRRSARSTAASTCAGASIATGASAARSMSSRISSPRCPTTTASGVLDDGAMVANVANVPGKKRRTPSGPSGDVPVGNKTVTPDDGLGTQKVNPDSSVTDKQALFSANQWISAFATAAVDKLVKLSTVPFYAGGQDRRTDLRRPEGHVQRARRRVRSDEGLEADDAQRIHLRRRRVARRQFRLAREDREGELRGRAHPDPVRRLSRHAARALIRSGGP